MLKYGSINFSGIHSNQIKKYQKVLVAKTHNVRGRGINDDSRGTKGTGNDKSRYEH